MTKITLSIFGMLKTKIKILESIMIQLLMERAKCRDINHQFLQVKIHQIIEPNSQLR